MWDFIVRQLLKETGRKIGGRFFNDEANGPEAYADRIKRDLRLHDYADAWALYDADRAYWERWYGPLPGNSDPHNEFVRDSAAAAGIPSRKNVFEYGYPEPTSGERSTNAAQVQNSVERLVASDPMGLPAPDASSNDSKNVRRLVRLTQPTAAFLVDEGTKPAAMPNEIPNDQAGSFDDRFGNWTSSGTATAPRGPYQAISPQAARPLGIVTGDPTPNYPFPMPIWGFPNNKDAPDDWTDRKLRRPNSKRTR